MTIHRLALAVPITLALCSGASAQPTPDAPPPNVVFRNFSNDSTAGPYEPDKAQRNGVNGVAVIECKTDSAGDLSTCQLIAQAPEDFGFDMASFVMAKAHAIRAPVSMRPTQAGALVTVRLTVPFIVRGVLSDPVELDYLLAADAAGRAHFDVAISGFSAVIKARPDYAPAYLKRGLTYYQLNQADLAIKDLDRAITLRSASLPKVPSQAMDERPMPSEQDTDYALAYYVRASLHADRGETDLSISDYGEAIKLKPEYRDAYLDRAIAYDTKGAYDLAIADDDQAIKLQLGVDAYRNRAAAQAHAGRFAMAIADYDRAVALEPQDAQTYLNRGATYHQQGAYEQAIKDFDQAITMDAHLGVAFQYRCMARAMSGKALDLALADCDQSLTLKPGDPGALSVRSLVQFRLARFDRAVADADAALASHQATPRTLYVRGVAKRKLGDAAAGDADIAAAKALDPKIVETAAGYGVSP